MNKIGVRLHDLGKATPDVLAKQAKDLGFSGIQLVLKKALTYDQPLDHLNAISDGFQSLDIPLLGAYFNPVHPDPNQVQAGMDNFLKHLDIAPIIGASYVGTETGSLMGSPWGYVPDNHQPETMAQLIPVIRQLVSHAERIGAHIAIEGAYAHVAYSPRVLRHVLDAIDSPNLRVIVDLYNYLHIGNHQERNHILEDCFKYLKADTVIYHLKDYIVEDGALKQVGLGQGLMDFAHIIQRIHTETPEAYLIFEGVKQDDMRSSMEHITTILDTI